MLLVLMAAEAAAVADAVRPPAASGKADTSSPPSAAATAAASPSDRLPDAGAAVSGACWETVAWAAKGLTSSSAAGEGIGYGCVQCLSVTPGRCCTGASSSGPLQCGRCLDVHRPREWMQPCRDQALCMTRIVAGAAVPCCCLGQFAGSVH